MRSKSRWDAGDVLLGGITVSVRDDGEKRGGGREITANYRCCSTGSLAFHLAGSLCTRFDEGGVMLVHRGV